MVRTGHFSYLSADNGSFFLHDAPASGFPERPVGYAIFNYSSNTFWWTDLKALVASNIPVVLLMKYAPNDDTGHYRVIVGYDENKAEVYFMDPWDRDLGRMKNPDGTVIWNMTDFQYAWNYSKYRTAHPYWGAVIMPWSLNLHTSGRTTAGSILKVTADITYPCPRPFDCSAFPASDTTAELILPQGAHLEKYIGDLRAGESYTVTWNVQLNTDSAGSNITARAEGLVSGAVPDVIWPGVFYPAYNYADRIGGEANINIQ